MSIAISENLLRHYLRNAYFITGHSYAGKSTMVHMLAERYGLIECGENYNDAFPREKLSRWQQPGLSYFDTMSGWEEWLSMTPEQHYRWTEEVGRECAEIEILELIRRTADGSRAIADTNMPLDVLRKVAEPDHVAVMLCDPPDASATRFFKRDDPDKRFMLEQIQRCKNPEATMKNFTGWLTYQPPEPIDWAHTGFFTYTRTDFVHDTREEVLNLLARHFGLEK